MIAGRSYKRPGPCAIHTWTSPLSALLSVPLELGKRNRFDHCFWFGDLNYRLDPSSEQDLTGCVYLLSVVGAADGGPWEAGGGAREGGGMYLLYSSISSDILIY